MQRGVFFYSVPQNGMIALKPNNGRQPTAIFPNCIIFPSELHRELLGDASAYWHPAQVPLAASKANWIINFCADADEYPDALAYLARKTRSRAIPVFNRPEAVLATARDRVTGLLEGMPNLVLPRCIRFSPRLPEDFARVFIENGFEFPVMVRPTASQTGRGLIVIDDPKDWDKVHTIDWAGRELYMTQYVDLRDRNGLRTKIRIAFINRQPFYRHAFTSDDRLIRVAPRTQDSMDWETEYLARLQERPDMKLLVSELARRVELNFWGADLGIGADGRVLFFEATAAMSLTQDYSTAEEHDRLYPILLEPIVRALAAAAKDPGSWNLWRRNPAPSP